MLVGVSRFGLSHPCESIMLVSPLFCSRVGKKRGVVVAVYIRDEWSSLWYRWRYLLLVPACFRCHDKDICFIAHARMCRARRRTGILYEHFVSSSASCAVYFYYFLC